MCAQTHPSVLLVALRGQGVAVGQAQGRQVLQRGPAGGGFRALLGPVLRLQVGCYQMGEGGRAGSDAQQRREERREARQVLALEWAW